MPVPAGKTLIPSGTVTFLDGTTTLGTGTIKSGTATYTTSALAVGTHSLTATYGGDLNFSSSTSPAFTQTIVAASVALMLGLIVVVLSKDHRLQRCRIEGVQTPVGVTP